jgi:hypothetical protein
MERKALPCQWLINYPIFETSIEPTIVEAITYVPLNLSHPISDFRHFKPFFKSLLCHMWESCRGEFNEMCRRTKAIITTAARIAFKIRLQVKAEAQMLDETRSDKFSWFHSIRAKGFLRLALRCVITSVLWPMLSRRLDESVLFRRHRSRLISFGEWRTRG